jgi:hypothetical protein
MDTPLVLNLVRGRLDDIDALKEEIQASFGAEPSINLRMEIALNDELVILAINNGIVTVTDAKRDELVTQGAADLARFAIKGLDSTIP